MHSTLIVRTTNNSTQCHHSQITSCPNFSFLFFFFDWTWFVCVSLWRSWVNTFLKWFALQRTNFRVYLIFDLFCFSCAFDVRVLGGEIWMCITNVSWFFLFLFCLFFFATTLKWEKLSITPINSTAVQVENILYIYADRPTGFPGASYVSLFHMNTFGEHSKRISRYEFRYFTRKIQWHWRFVFKRQSNKQIEFYWFSIMFVVATEKNVQSCVFRRSGFEGRSPSSHLSPFFGFVNQELSSICILHPRDLIMFWTFKMIAIICIPRKKSKKNRICAFLDPARVVELMNILCLLNLNLCECTSHV